MDRVSLFLGIVLSVLVAQAAGRVYAASLEGGNYTPLAGASTCDFHVESSTKKLFLTSIANQQTRESCDENGKTYEYECGSDDTCTYNDDSQDEPKQKKLTIIDSKNFLDGNTGLKYVFKNSQQVLPALKFTRWGVYGYQSQPAEIFTSGGGNRCMFRVSGERIACNDETYARKVFCIQAYWIAAQTALRDCKKETGKDCVNGDIYGYEREPDIYWFSTLGYYNKHSQTYEAIATLACKAYVTVLAEEP